MTPGFLLAGAAHSAGFPLNVDWVCERALVVTALIRIYSLTKLIFLDLQLILR